MQKILTFIAALALAACGGDKTDTAVPASEAESETTSAVVVTVPEKV